MPLTLPAKQFLEESLKLPSLIVDARSPAEYAHAHIPGAFNLPLLDNEQRAIVGTTFKKQGREAAVQKGFDLVGPGFGNFIRTMNEAAPQRNLFIYCWRGGMRSGIMAWVLSMGGFKVTLLHGGYKSYRKLVLEEINKDRNYIVIGGKTGSGKTEALNTIAQQACALDLEGLAHHKGSAFGSLGQLPQPGNEMFENLVAEKFFTMPAGEPVWIENESRNIGSVMVPVSIFEAIRTAPLVEIVSSDARRRARIKKEYCVFPVSALAEATKKVRKRLGEVRLKEALNHLDSGRLEAWVDMMLVYYDKMYNFGMEQRSDNVTKVEVADDESMDSIASRMMAARKEMEFSRK